MELDKIEIVIIDVIGYTHAEVEVFLVGNRGTRVSKGRHTLKINDVLSLTVNH